MPKNINGGNRTKKKKNKLIIRPLVFADNKEGIMYACVNTSLGFGRYILDIINNNPFTSKFNKEVNGIIRGTIRKKKIKKGEIVLVALRLFQNEIDYNNVIVDIIHYYNETHSNQLINMGEIDKKYKQIIQEDYDDNVVFEKDSNYNSDDSDDSDILEYDNNYNSKDYASIYSIIDNQEKNNRYYENLEDNIEDNVEINIENIIEENVEINIENNIEDNVQNIIDNEETNNIIQKDLELQKKELELKKNKKKNKNNKYTNHITRINKYLDINGEINISEI